VGGEDDWIFEVRGNIHLMGASSAIEREVVTFEKSSGFSECPVSIGCGVAELE